MKLSRKNYSFVVCSERSEAPPCCRRFARSTASRSRSIEMFSVDEEDVTLDVTKGGTVGIEVRAEELLVPC